MQKCFGWVTLLVAPLGSWIAALLAVPGNYPQDTTEQNVTFLLTAGIGLGLLIFAPMRSKFMLLVWVPLYPIYLVIAGAVIEIMVNGLHLKMF